MQLLKLHSIDILDIIISLCAKLAKSEMNYWENKKMAMERFMISISSEGIDLFERGRADMGMNKSSYIRFLIAEHENKVPAFIKYKEIIELLSEVNTHIKSLLLKENLDDMDKILLMEKLEKTNEVMKKLLKE